MPLIYHIDRAARLVHLTGDTPPSADEWRRLLQSILADPDYEPGFNFLSDRRGLREPPSTAYIYAAAAILTDHAPALGRCQFAIIVSQPAAYGMYRMGGILAEGAGVDVNVFRDLGQALRWLGVDPKRWPAESAKMASPVTS